MGSKFFVWARGRWREVCAQSGRVQGAGAARFLFARGGRLLVARASRVLGALRSLTDRQPSAVSDGPPLPQRRSGLSKRRQSRSQRHQKHCCCGAHGHSCISLKDVPKATIQAIGPNRTDAAVQVEGIIPPAPITVPNITADLSPVKANQHTETAQVHPRPRAKRKRTSSEESSLVSDENSTLKLRRGTCKELVIDEEDVDLYRSYMLRRDPNFDVYRFDTDDDYKLRVFYRINPLVSLRRCARLECMLARRSQEPLSLKEFATNLGLRSVSDQESEKSHRYRMRNRKSDRKVEEEKNTVKSDSKSDSKSDDNDKENEVRHSGKNRNGAKPAPDRTLRKRLMVEAVRRNVSEMSVKSVKSAPSSQSSKSDKPAPLVTKALSSSSDDEFLNKPTFVAKKPPPKKNPMKFLSQPTKLKTKWCGSGREYSSQEDHAIVAFVSGGDRARRVNGNRVWQELQEHYPRLTGSSRSWHSLRNRYLRYILPALGALALPPADVSRLRAAAARGEIKSRPRSSAPPVCMEPRVRTAWGARPRPPPADSPEPPADSPEPPADSPEPPADSPEPPADPPPRARRSSPPARAAQSPIKERLRRLEDVSPTAAPPSPARRRRLLRSSGVSLPPHPSPPPFRAPHHLPHAAVRPRLRKLFNHNA